LRCNGQPRTDAHLVTILKLPYTPFALPTDSDNDDLVKSAPHANAANAKGFRFAIVASRWNDSIVSRLIEGARLALEELQADVNAIKVFRVPGSFEIPLCALKAAESGKFDAVICLGVIIRGETPHFEYIAAEVARGIGEAGMKTGVPLLFGVITAENVDQAIDRAGARLDNKGYEAAMAAVELVNLYKEAFGAETRAIARG
jgi:6,7-dimethyl-8-ribityllumazine synthase